MEKERTNEFRESLEKEKVRLEGELSTMAKRDPANKEDWVPTLPTTRAPARADKNELADRFSEFSEKQSTELQLEIRLNNIKRALARIEEGTYGTCEVCGKEINPERLEANHAATNCIDHAT